MTPVLGRKYKRRLIVDAETVISNLEMRKNISDPSDTVVATPAMAPPTKRLMHWKMNGGVERIFGLPGKELKSNGILGGYKDRLIATAQENEFFNMLGDHETEGIELKYSPGEKELEQMLEMLSRTKGKPGRKPRVKVEPVERSFASESNQPLDLSQPEPIRVKSEMVGQGVKRYDASPLSLVLESAAALFKVEEEIVENRECRITRVG